MKLLTNGHDYDVYQYHEIPAHIQREYTEEYDALAEVLNFFRYKGTWYSTSDFIVTDAYPGWDGYYALNSFASVLVKLSPLGTTVKVATLLH